MKVTIGKKNEKQTLSENKSAETIETNSKSKKVSIGHEIISKRGKYSKIFSDGHGKAAVKYYGTPVHYRKTEKSFEEINNELKDKGEFYETASNSFKAKFGKRFENGKVMDISRGDYGIELISCEAAGSNNANLISYCGNDKSKIKFCGINKNSDLEYAVKPEGVKENIIINEKSEKYEYGFELNVKNLEPFASEDGKKLGFRTKETGKEVFNIPAPIMEDAKGERSDNVYYEITTETPGKLALKVVADERWINAKERTFPVAIDPQINVVDQFVGEYEYNYEDSDSDSIFRYITITPAGEYIDKELRIFCSRYGTAEYTHSNCRLVILKDKIPAKMLEGLNSAKLYMKGNGSSMYGFSINGSDSFYWVENNEFEIDLFSEFEKEGDEISIWFENDHSRGGHSECNVTFDAPILELGFDDYITKIEIAADPVKGYAYLPGDKFDTEGLILNAIYYSGEIVPVIYPDFTFTPSGSLTTYDKKITFYYNGAETWHELQMYQGGFNDRRPKEGCENVYTMQYVDKDTGNPIDNNMYYIRLTLTDGAKDEDIGTPINAENLNRNIIVDAEHIYGIIKQENLPDYLKKTIINDNESDNTDVPGETVTEDTETGENNDPEETEIPTGTEENANE